MAFNKTGTVSFDLKPLAQDVLDSDSPHKIGQIEVGDGLSISLLKNAERRLEVHVAFDDAAVCRAGFRG